MNIHRQAPTPFVGDNFEVVPEPGSTKLVMYFTATGAPHRYFNFWRAGNALKTHRIFVNNARAWYQQGVPGLGSSVEETVETVRRWADYLGASELYTVGGSMGGYGATLFGTLLSAPVLAFSFESELDLEGSRSRKLMDPGTLVTHRDLRPLIEKATKPIFAIVGERDPIDVYSIDRIRHFPMVTAKSIRRILHGPQNYLNKLNRLVPLIEDFINGASTLPKMQEDGDVFWRPGFPALYFQTHQHHAAKQWEEAVETGKKALALFPTSEQCNWLVGDSLMRLKRLAEAYPFLYVARNAAGPLLQNYFSLATCARQMGLPADAIYLHKQTLARWPDHAKTHYCMGLAFLKLRNKTNAGAAFQRAAELEPNNASYMERTKANPVKSSAPDPV